ncbi:MAG: hypothetical protein WAW41_09280 [Methylobacter sp.]
MKKIALVLIMALSGLANAGTEATISTAMQATAGMVPAKTDAYSAAFFAGIKSLTYLKKRVSIPGFGVFYPRESYDTTCLNVFTGATYPCPKIRNVVDPLDATMIEVDAAIHAAGNAVFTAIDGEAMRPVLVSSMYGLTKAADKTLITGFGTFSQGVKQPVFKCGVETSPASLTAKFASATTNRWSGFTPDVAYTAAVQVP